MPHTMRKMSILTSFHMKRKYVSPESDLLRSDFAEVLLTGSDYGPNGDSIGDLNNPDNW